MMNLTLGQIYKITTKDWTPPVGPAIPGEVKIRKVLGSETIEHVHFLRVERPDGTAHRIELQTIARTEPVAACN